MKKVIAILLSVTLLFSGLVFSAAEKDETDYVPGEVLVIKKTTTRKKGYSAQSALPFNEYEIIDTSAIDADGARKNSNLSRKSAAAADNVQVIKGKVDEDTDLERLCKELKKRDDILNAAPNYIRKADEIQLPSELNMSGSAYNSFNIYSRSMAYAEGWESAGTFGSESVVVGVIDTGVNTEHKELKDNLWDDGNGNHGWNAVADNYDTSDTNGHGSNVAGIIAMAANDFGYVGVAPSVKIMPLKAAPGVNLSDDNILECLNYAVENGADVVNMSFGGTNFSEVMATEYQRAARKTVLVAAAGNDGESTLNSLEYPAAHAGVIGVMSYGSYKDGDRAYYTTDNAQLSSFSNYDESGEYYQLAAFGVDVAGPSPSDNEDFIFKTGTSQASPMTAGAAALYLSVYPDASSYQVRRALIESADETLDGYYDNARYKKLDIAQAIKTEPCKDSEIQLSDSAKGILSACFNESFNKVYASDMDALSYISYSEVYNYADDLSALSELYTAEKIDLSYMGLEQQALDGFASGSFYRLHSLDLSGNEDLTSLPLDESFAPILRELNINACSFYDPADFSALKSLTVLYAESNDFKTSIPLKNLTKLKKVSLYNCKLQDVQAFKDLDELIYLDVSNNYISDISPLTTFRGNYLDISYNPLNLNNENAIKIKQIERFMNDNAYSYLYIKFYHDGLNGDDDDTYTAAKSISFLNKRVARSEEAFALSADIKPENANVNSYCLFSTKSEKASVKGETLLWNKADFESTEQVRITVTPVSGFSPFEGNVTVLAPEIYRFFYKNSHYTLSANEACDSVTINGTVYTDFVYREGARFFEIPDTLAYSENLTAVPSDSVGNGKAVKIGTAAPEEEQAKIISFTADKGSYSTSEAANLTVTGDSDTNYVKIKDCNENKEYTLSAYETDENGNHIFTLKRSFNYAAAYKFKAYASYEGTFNVGAAVLTLSVGQDAESLKLQTSNGAELYLTDGADETEIDALIYPENAAFGTDISFVSSDESVAEVDENGKVKARSYGCTVITATSDNGLSSSLLISVNMPVISAVTVNAGNYDEATTFVFYTKGARGVTLTDENGERTEFDYSASYENSDKAGYDRKYTITAVVGDYDYHAVRIYATDKNGLNIRKSNFKTVYFNCVNPITDFEISPAAVYADRNGDPVKINITKTPADANSDVKWSVSPTKLARISGSSGGAYLTAKGTGTVTVTASARINGADVSKSCEVTFGEGKIISAEFETLTPTVYKPFTVTVTTSKTVKYIHLYDTVNMLGTEYSEPYFYNDDGENRVWTVPFYFMRSSNEIRVWGGDSVGNLSEAKYYDISAAMPEQQTLACNDMYYIGKVDDILAVEPIMLPDFKAPGDDVSVTVDHEDIAAYADGYITLKNLGETVMHISSDGKTVNIPIKVYNPVNLLKFGASSLHLTVGESRNCELTITPEKYSGKVKFTSSDETVASVDENGTIHANMSGTAVITAASDNGVKATVTVKVTSEAALESLAFEKQSYILKADESIKPVLITDKSDFCDEIRFDTSNTNIASVTEDGTVKALKEGTVKVRAFTDTGLRAETTVTVTAESRLVLSQTYVRTTVNTVTALSAYAQPSGKVIDGAWRSDNEQVATVTAGGYVYAKSPGTCNITYLSDNGESAVCVFKVDKTTATRMTLEKFADGALSLKLNENYILQYTLTPAYAEDEIRWISDDESVAVVNENGVVSAKGVGTAMITAVLTNDRTYAFTVEVSAEEFTLNGEINTAAVLTLTDKNGESREYNVSGSYEITGIAAGEYTAKLSAVHHTYEKMFEVTVYGDTYLGSCTLANGDANADGSVNVGDISLLLTDDIYGKPTQNEWYDINGDGQISIDDISEILLTENYAKASKEIVF